MLAVVYLVLFVALRPAQPSRAQGATHLQTVTAEYTLLLGLYRSPLEPAALLTAAWEGATGYLRRQNVPVSTALPRLTSDRAQALAAFSTAWNALATEAGGSVDFTQVAFSADDEMASSLSDDHTYFLPPDVYDAFKQELGGADATQIGAGIESTTRPPHVVLDVAPGSGADQVGILPGDIVTAVGGVDATLLANAAYLGLLSGSDGDVLTITVNRPGAGPMDFQVTLGPFHFPIFSAKVLAGGVGYMRLRSFVDPWTLLERGENVVQQLDDALQSFEAAGATTWILDLRDDGGGLIATAQAFLGRFLPADAVVDVAADARSHRSQDLADGHTFAVQRPMAVLVNRGSGSASEIVASALHEYDRALLVGRTTAGGLGANEFMPLPDGAAVGVTIATIVSGRNQTQIDGLGVPVDVSAGAPSAADLAAGRDPAIDAALQALAGRQAFTPPPSTDATLDILSLRAALGPYELATAEVPTAPNIATVHNFGDYVIDRYSEWSNWEGPASDAVAARELPRQRGWQGAEFQFFGENSLGPFLVTGADLYATADGAAAAVGTDDFPDLLVPASPPIQLGDQTVAYSGQWSDTGQRAIVWRHGRLVLTVAYQAVPGSESFDPIVAMARAVESHYLANPLP